MDTTVWAMIGRDTSTMLDSKLAWSFQSHGRSTTFYTGGVLEQNRLRHFRGEMPNCIWETRWVHTESSTSRHNDQCILVVDLDDHDPFISHSIKTNFHSVQPWPSPKHAVLFICRKFRGNCHLGLVPGLGKRFI